MWASVGAERWGEAEEGADGELESFSSSRWKSHRCIAAVTAPRCRQKPLATIVLIAVSAVCLGNRSKDPVFVSRSSIHMVSADSILTSSVCCCGLIATSRITILCPPPSPHSSFSPSPFLSNLPQYQRRESIEEE